MDFALTLRSYLFFLFLLSRFPILLSSPANRTETEIHDNTVANSFVSFQHEALYSPFGRLFQEFTDLFFVVIALLRFFQNLHEPRIVEIIPVVLGSRAKRWAR